MATTGNEQQVTRRDFAKGAATAAAAAAAIAATGLAVPAVHAAESNTINVALVGCGGRGTGAAQNALSVKNGMIKLTAMVDIFPQRVANAYRAMQRYATQVEVPEDRKFIGFDGYKKAMDTLRKGDVVILTTPPAFRWPMFKYAISKGLNVFMEKPVTVDAPTTVRMLELNKEAKAKNLKVGVGLMCRHCDARKELLKRIQDGEIGEIVAMYGYRMGGRAGVAGRKPDRMSETLYQVQRFHSFLWASGGIFSDYNIHQIDECSMMKGSFPVSCKASGGRHFRGDALDQNFDNYSVEYTFGDGTKLFFTGRTQDGCYGEFASYALGSKNSAVISTHVHTPAKCRTYRGHRINEKDALMWAYPQPERNPYQLEWDYLIDAIRNDKPWNEVDRGCQASLVTSMGRMAAHTGQLITYDQMLKVPHEFAPDVENLTADGPAPLQLDKDGKYPFPTPGKFRDLSREY